MIRESASSDLAIVAPAGRRFWLVLALLAVMLFAFQPGPGHADVYDAVGPAAAADHHPGDGDSGHGPGHAGIHCASHCGGHAAATHPGIVLEAGRQRLAGLYALRIEAAHAGRDEEPPTRPPAV